jgi:hypothetical protein
MKTVKRILFFIAGITLLVACSKSDGFFGSDSFENSLKNCQYGPVIDLKYIPGTVYTLSGKALYNTWQVKDGTVLQNNKWDCAATLEFLKNRGIRYTFSELRPNGPANIVCYGKIAASGILTFKFPAPLFTLPDGTKLYITDIIRAHACAKIWGEGINEGTLVFKGKFDGTRFTATAKFMATVASPCPSNDIFDPALVDGPLHWTFGYDLTVD